MNTIAQMLPADWPIGTVAYFAVDYDGGSDTNLGFSLVSMAAAGAAPMKTLEQLVAVFPKLGNGRKAVIAIKSRAAGATYRNPANTANGVLNMLGVSGYAPLLVRGTATIATAGCTAFDNSTADKIALGAITVAGTNAAGYKATGAPTTSVIQCLTAAGGAPGFAAEPALNGKRIRFDSATPTALLRNATGMIYQVAGTDTLTIDTNLPAVPATGGSPDIFYIEGPGVAMESCSMGGANALLSFAGSFKSSTNFAGIRCVSTTDNPWAVSGADALIKFSFVEGVGGGGGFAGFDAQGFIDIRIQRSYDDETGTSRTTGVGGRFDSFPFFLEGFNVVVASTTVTDVNFATAVTGILAAGLGQGCYLLSGVQVVGSVFVNGGRSGNKVAIGNNASSTVRRLRVTQKSVSGGQTGAIDLVNIDAIVRGVDVTGIVGIPAIALTSVLGNGLKVDDAVGSTSNDTVGIDVTNAKQSRCLLGILNANTITGTLGDIRVAGTAITTHAGLTTTNVIDNQGNNLVGTAGQVVHSSMLVVNKAGGAVAIGKIMRGNATTLQATTALADTSAHATGVLGVLITPPAADAVNCYIATTGAPWVQLDVAGTVSNLCYLSEANAGQGKSVPPALAATNQKLRLGYIQETSGTLGRVVWQPELVPIVSDGVAP